MVNKERRIWLKGNILKIHEAKINVLSPTAQFGANVFEGIRCYWNETLNQLYAFRLDDHYCRLQNSAKLFRLQCPYSVSKMKEYLIETIKANEYQEDIAVRQMLFVDGFGSWFSTEPVEMFISPVEKKRVAHPIEKGKKVCISSWERISSRDISPRVKVGANYINSRLAKLEAIDRGYDDALFLNKQGFLSEGTGSCFFMIKGNSLITPMLTDSILESITRDTIKKLAHSELNLEVVERNIDRMELYICDEAFLCGSAVEIVPIIQIDNYFVGNGRPGNVTQEIHKLYLDVVTGKIDKYMDWLTPVYEVK